MQRMTDLLAAANAPGLPQGRFWGLIPCAGVGTRAIAPGTPTPDLPKQYHLVAGQPLVLHTLAAFAGVQRLAGTLVAVAPQDQFLDSYSSSAWWHQPCGGATRADTVMGGLKALLARGAAQHDWVLVHDAARCLVTAAQINQLIDACEHDSVGGLLAHKLADTLKTAVTGATGVRVAATVDRSDKWLAQTPQMFRLGALLDALGRMGAAATDEASAMEAMGHRPQLIAAGAQNFKVTYPDDFALAEAVLTQRAGGATMERFKGKRDHALPTGNPFF
jgi:2-C-methyl-D-erythritol 4-phosphate cytidylyltransferase